MTRVVFMGTPDFAVPALKALIDTSDFEVVGVVTQPDRPAGRGNAIQMPPIKQLASAVGIPVIQPNKLRDPGVFDQLTTWNPDVIVVAAFGQILRQNVLSLPRYGCINVHASLLPRWRGAAPIQAAIRAGDRETGITIMQMDAGLDTGAMLRQRAVPITDQDTGATLHDKLAEVGGPLLIETLLGYIQGTIHPQPQPEGDFGYAAMMKKEDGLIDWSQPVSAIDRQIRAFDPWPGTYTLWNGTTLKILAGIPRPDLHGTPGSVFSAHDGTGTGTIAIGTGEGSYSPTKVQLAGKPATTIAAFVNGHKTFEGSKLDLASKT
jgi:methionyl-tRNA formyltransferase